MIDFKIAYAECINRVIQKTQNLLNGTFERFTCFIKQTRLFKKIILAN